jgi:hypothetical protein
MGRKEVHQKEEESQDTSRIRFENTQIIDAIRTFVLPMSEFLLRHSNMWIIKLQKFDTYLRKLINLKIGGLPRPKEKVYLRTPDGGFCLYALNDPCHIHKIPNLAHLLRSSIGSTIQRYIPLVA